jgi:hypothetical protein
MLNTERKKYEINTDRANDILQNVFAAGSLPPNTVPFDKLVLRGKLNTRLFDLPLFFAGLLLVLTFVCPLCIVPLAERLDPAYSTGYARLVEDYVEEDCLYLKVEGRRILYGEAYLETADGQTCHVLSYDRASGILCFPYISDSETNIYIPVKDGAPLHLLLSPQPGDE